MTTTDQHPEFVASAAAGIRPLVHIVSCGKQKLATAAPARDLYTGDLTSKQLAWVDTRSGEFGGEPMVLIASARYGLVDLDTTIEPYDDALTTMTTDEVEAWIAMVAGQARERGIDGARVWAYGGAAYTSALRRVFGKVHNDETTDNPQRTRSAFVGERKAGFKKLLAYTAAWGA